MAETFTTNAGIGYPAVGDLSWGASINTYCIEYLDGFTALGDLAVTNVNGQGGTGANVAVAAGTFVTQDGAVNTYAGTGSFALTTSQTNYLYLDGAASWALTKSTSGWPTTAHVRLAVIAVGSSNIMTLTDWRQPWGAVGTWYDGLNINIGTTTGLKLGTASTQKIGFLGAAATFQQVAGADPITALATFGFKAAEGTPSVAAQTGAGVGASASISGTDRRGVITLTTGSASSTGTQAIITFSGSGLPAIPKAVLLTPANALAAGVIIDVFSDVTKLSATQFTLDAATLITASTGPYKWYYNIQG